MRIVFMGTPDYAAKTLQKIIKAGHDVCGVFAQPDKQVGRKRILTAPPVKVLAQQNGIPVFHPGSLRDGQAFSIIEDLEPELIVVVAYGKILPEEILNFPKYKCINGHASLLPKYRGASPIQWAIICGEKKTGITIMYMDKGMDTGDIIETCETEIKEDETAEELFARLSIMSADLMVETIEKIENGTSKRVKQNEDEATYAPIIKKEMAQLDFNKRASEIYCAIRGYYSWPMAYFMLNGKRIKVTKAEIGSKTLLEPSLVSSVDNGLEIACGDNKSIRIIDVIPEGAKPMSAKQMLLGNPLKIGEKVGE